MEGRQKLAAYLQESGVSFSVVTHPEAFTAQEVAAAGHVPGRNFVKVVMVFADDRLAMLCLPAPFDVDFDAAAEAFGCKKVRLATEDEFSGTFPDCEVGAMPPFGNLYEVPVYLDETVLDGDSIVFNACNHREMIEIPREAYVDLVKPEVTRFSRRHELSGV